MGPSGLLQLGDTRQIYVDAVVYIDDVPSIRLGQKTLTTGVALPLPVPLGTAIASLVAYASYTVHHDATHKAISGRSPRWRWVEVACGTVAAAALGLEFRGYAANHLRHHAHTNQDTDPDLLVKGPLWQVPLKWAVLMVLVTVGALPFGDRLVRRVLRRVVPAFAAPSSGG